MARLRVSKGTKLVQAYSQIAMQPGAGKMAEWAWDVRRLIILGKRANSGDLIGAKDPNTSEHSVIDPYVENELQQAKTVEHPRHHAAFINNEDQQQLSDFVAIVDIDAGGYNKGYETIKLPFIPKELNYEPTSSFVSIKPIGRNTPKYHFTGSEDILEFEIDWYANDFQRREVIQNCRKIEALSKSDGYENDPHRVMLYWGEDNLLFQDHVFVVLSAPYKLVQFNKGYLATDNTIVKTHMLPIQAYQKVRLGRISSFNLTKNAIQYVAPVPNTSSTYKRSQLNKGI